MKRWWRSLWESDVYVSSYGLASAVVRERIEREERETVPAELIQAFEPNSEDAIRKAGW